MPSSETQRPRAFRSPAVARQQSLTQDLNAEAAYEPAQELAQQAGQGSSYPAVRARHAGRPEPRRQPAVTRGMGRTTKTTRSCRTTPPATRSAKGRQRRLESWQPHAGVTPIRQSSNRRITQSPDCRITQSPDCQIAQSSDCRITQSPDCQIAQSSDCRITQSPDCQIAQSSDCRIAQSSDCRITQSPDCQIAQSSDCRIAQSSDCRITQSSDCRITQSPDCLVLRLPDCSIVRLPVGRAATLAASIRREQHAPTILQVLRHRQLPRRGPRPRNRPESNAVRPILVLATQGRIGCPTLSTAGLE